MPQTTVTSYGKRGEGKGKNINMSPWERDPSIQCHLKFTEVMFIISIRKALLYTT